MIQNGKTVEQIAREMVDRRQKSRPLQPIVGCSSRLTPLGEIRWRRLNFKTDQMSARNGGVSLIANRINRVDRNTYAVLTVVIAAAMFYLELYPFKFRVPVNGHGALRKLVETWADRPQLGDFVRNVIAYMALSFCATMTLGYHGGRRVGLLLSYLLEQPLP